MSSIKITEMPTSVCCDHCLLKINKEDALREMVDGEYKYFCCQGCRNVYHIIHGRELDEFYRRRRNWQPGPPDDSEINYSLFSDKIKESGGSSEVDIILTGVRCATCIWLIEHFLSKLDGIVSARVNYATHRARIKWDPERINLRDILDSLRSIGYSPRPYTPSHLNETLNTEKKDLLIRFGTAAFFSMQLMLYTAALYAGYFQGIEERYRTIFQFITWALATPVMFYSGFPFIKNSLNSLKTHTLNMDVLVFLGSFSAYSYSILMIFTGGEVYFDTSAMIITLILLGRFLEVGAKGRAGEAITSLMALQPKEARVIRKSSLCVQRADSEVRGQTSEDKRMEPVSMLKARDIIEVIPGEKIPLDGVVIEGSSEVNESMLTGESRPVLKKEGAEVYSGTISLNGRLVIRITRTGKDTVLAQIIKAVEDAQARKAPIQALADRVVGFFVPGVIVIAASSFLYWYLYNGETVTALMNAVSVLVIACPCALGLATPMAVLMGSSIASKMGILIKGGDIFEMVSRTDLVVFDKTGTLTKGKPQLTDMIDTTADGSLLRYAASLESVSEHTIGRAILAAYDGELFEVKDFRSIPGTGIEAMVNGRLCQIGNMELINKNGIPVDKKLEREYQSLTSEGKTVVFVIIEGAVAGMLAVVDELRDDAYQMLKDLRRRGIGIKMLTGDSFNVARYISKKTGITDFSAEVTPLEKASIIRKFVSEGQRVMMVGDGINDAPALIEADVGVAVGRATDVALESSDVVIMKDDLSLVYRLIDISRTSFTVIKQNLTWAFSYNLVAIPLAVAGMLHPIISAVSMAASSLIVVGNSIRLNMKQGA
jgi:Cu2+-exporting ATPase